MLSLRQRLVLSVPALLAFSLYSIASYPQNPDAPQSSDAKPAPPAQNQRPPGTIRVVSTNVIVPVTVKDHNGQLVADLHREEFRLFEDSIEQKITTFTTEPVPLSMVLLIDNDLKSKDADQVANSLRSIVAGISSRDEAYVCRFDQFFHPGKGFTSDQDKLLTELKRTEIDSHTSVAPPSAAINNGPTINGHSATSDAPVITGQLNQIKGQPTKTLDDAVYASAELLKDRGPNRRKVIVLISDGVNGAKFNTNSYSTTVQELLRHETAVYSVAVGSAFFDRKFSRLVDYAHDTGGDVYFAEKTRAMEELYSRVMEEARNQYVLNYNPSGTDRGKDYHVIEVRVEREGLKIIAREGYYSGGGSR